jgi:hypothetical protein
MVVECLGFRFGMFLAFLARVWGERGEDRASVEGLLYDDEIGSGKNEASSGGVTMEDGACFRHHRVTNRTRFCRLSKSANQLLSLSL